MNECWTTFTFTFNHLADAFIQSDVQMKRTIEAIRPSKEQQYTQGSLFMCEYINKYINKIYGINCIQHII